MSGQLKTAMILAAGMGSRLRPLTEDTPKPLINVGGKPVILRTLELLAAAGINRVVINTHYLATMLETTVRAHTPAGLQVFFSHEDELLETGGGLKKALPLLGEKPFLVINSDAVWLERDFPLLRPLMDAFDIKKHDALLTVVPLKQTRAFQPLGDFEFEKRTKRLTRKGNRDGWNVVYAGIHMTHPAFIEQEAGQRFSLNRLWDAAREEGRLHGFYYDHQWVDMGTHTGLHYARALVSAQEE